MYKKIIFIILILVSCDSNIKEGNLAHGMAEQEAMVVMHLSQFLAQLAHLFCAGDLVGTHTGTQVLHAGKGEA